MQYRVVVCSCLDASILVGAQCTNRALMMMEEEVTNILHPHRKKKHAARPHWTHLLIDEVSKLRFVIRFSNFVNSTFFKKIGGSRV